MFKTLRTAWKIADLRKKILYTLLMLLVFRLGSFVPVPGVNVDYISGVVSDNGLLGLLNTLSGCLLYTSKMGKMKRQGRTEGRRPETKKAYVTLTEKSKPIEFFESMAQ